MEPTSEQLAAPPTRTAPLPAVLIVNCQAREGTDGFLVAATTLEGMGLPLASSIRLEDPRALGGLVRDAVRGGAKLVVVGGGDGTLSEAANVLAGTDVTLGILPLGTANDFARNLRIPKALDAACRTLVSGRRRHIDLGRVNERYFINATSFGLTSAVTRRLTPDLKRRAGMLAYPVAAASEVISAEPFALTIETEVLHRTVDALQVVVGNGRYHGGGRIIAPEARLNDHLLDFYVITEEATGPGVPEGTDREQLRRLWLLARVAMLLRRGRHLTHPNVFHLRTRKVRLDAMPPEELDIDGELFGTTPATFEVAPGALSVMVPA